jgi:hypothetical protein
LDFHHHLISLKLNPTITIKQSSVLSPSPNTAPPSLLVQTQATNGSSSNPSITTEPHFTIITIEFLRAITNSPFSQFKYQTTNSKPWQSSIPLLQLGSTTTVNLSLPLNQTQAALFIVHNPSPNPPITAAVHIEAIKQTPPPCISATTISSTPQTHSPGPRLSL